MAFIFVVLLTSVESYSELAPHIIGSVVLLPRKQSITHTRAKGKYAVMRPVGAASQAVS